VEARMIVWHDIDSSRIKPEDFLACIEISKGSKNKYEVDKTTGMLILDRILYTATHYPANYGFIPRTYADDGDPLDVLVICSEPLVPLSLVRCYPIGQISMIDEGKEDIKIIAIPMKEPMWNTFKDIGELPNHVIEEIKHFFGVYKQLEGKKMEVLEISNAEVAKQTIKDNMEVYTRTFNKF
jgi:inorganic pyrophosphatase